MIVGQKVEFDDMVFRSPYYPYYEKYKGHVFKIDHFMEEDEEQQHVWLKCITNDDIVMDGYVELYQLKIVGEC